MMWESTAIREEKVYSLGFAHLEFGSNHLSQREMIDRTLHLILHLTPDLFTAKVYDLCA